MFPIQYDSFENLEESKKINIINAGFLAFAEYGYAKASVEEIVKKAGISKGSLFYYFGTKKNFLAYLYQHTATLLEQVVDNPGPEGTPTYLVYTDFFERLEAIQDLKMQANILYPHMTNFAKKIVLDTSPEAQELISSFNQKYTQERMMSFFQGLDYYKFKEGIEPMMVIQLLTWCSEGCVNQAIMESRLRPSTSEQGTDFTRIVALYKQYVAMFRNNFYKDEYL